MRQLQQHPMDGTIRAHVQHNPSPDVLSNVAVVLSNVTNVLADVTNVFSDVADILANFVIIA